MGLVEPLHRARDSARFGNKAAQLCALSAIAGVQVPPGFAISVEAFHQWLADVLPKSQWPERLLAGPEHERRGDRLEAIRARLLAAELPEVLWRQIVRAYDAMGRGPVAVRSSALHEDGSGGSAAGLQETHLGIESEPALGEAVKQCFASIYRERALLYLVRGSRTRVEVGVAIVVQRLVDADAAGVLFTADPVAHSSGTMIVEAAHGLGCAVVDGSLTPDVYRIEAATGVVRAARRGDKRFRVQARRGEIERVPLADEEAHREALGPEQLAALVLAGRTVEQALGEARDIEWAFEKGTLWLLQCRPIVGLAARGAGRDSWVWSNVNVGEALPGVATPLTWSVGVAFSELGFRLAFRALGCTVPADAELVGQFHGRIYLNLTAFMRIASQVPMLDPRMLLEFGGGEGLDLLERQVAPVSWLRFAPRAPLVAARFLAENVGIEARLARFESDFAEERRWFETTRLSELAARDLDAVLTRLGTLLDRTGAVMLTCASGALSGVIALRALLRSFVREDVARLERELLSGMADMESAAPGIALVHIAETARREPAAAAVIVSREPATLDLDALPRNGPTRRALEAFLRAYGYRAAREAELSTPRWRESPAALFATLRAQLERGDGGALARVERQSAARAQAEAEIERRVPAVAGSVIRHLLARTRRFVRLRERQRARVTEVLGFYRTVALEISRRLERRAPGIGHDAAFFLHLDELRAFLRGEFTDVAPLVRARRADVARDLARPDPPPVFVGMPPPFVAAAHDDTPSPHLVGIAASAGCVEGIARVVRDVNDAGALRPGEVLVVQVADVGWTPLFLAAAAVVTELGGALSHAAVVAREYGVPAVVNVAGATRVLRSGDRIRVDGDGGRVELVSRAIASEASRATGAG